MKLKLLLMILFINNCLLFSQSIFLYNLDKSNYPKIKANLIAFDKDNNQINNINVNELKLYENNNLTKIKNLNCPTNNEKLPLSTVLTIDVSGSMKNGNPVPNMEIAKTAAALWVKLMDGNSECAVNSFDGTNYLNQDFTKNKDLLIKAIDILTPMGSTNYSAGIFDASYGALKITPKGRYKRTIIFLTDGISPEFVSNKIVQEANNQNCTINVITLGINCPQSLKDMCSLTGGIFAENIKTEDEAKKVFMRFLFYSQGGSDCEIEWNSNPVCNNNVNIVSLLWNEQKTESSYVVPDEFLTSIFIQPRSYSFKNLEIGKQASTTITCAARNADFEVTNIKSNNSDFDINPKSFKMKKDEVIELEVTYTPKDSNYNYAKFEIVTKDCFYELFTSSIYLESKMKTLKVTFPNGGEKFLTGSDTIITWKGIPDSDYVSIDYSIDNGVSWKRVVNKATGLKYIWKNIPKPTSSNCLVRVNQININTSSLLPNTPPKFEYLGHSGFINSVCWSPDGKKFATAGADNLLIVWDDINKSLIKTMRFNSLPLNSVSWSPDGSKILTCSDDKVITVIDTIDYNVILKISDNINHSISWSPDGTKFATAGNDSTIKIWKSNSYTKITTLSGHKGIINSISWSPDGSKIVSGSDDSQIKIWNVANSNTILAFAGKTGKVLSVAWSPDGNKIASSGENNNAYIWDANTGNQLLQLVGHTNQISSVAWNKTSTKVATASNDRTCLVWDATSGNTDLTFTGHTLFANCLAWKPDGQQILTGGVDKSVLIWDAVNGNTIKNFTGHSKFVTGISWSKDDNLLATASQDKTFKIWNTVTGSFDTTVIAHTDYVNDIAYSPDGNYKATVSSDDTLKIWDKNNKLVKILKGAKNTLLKVVWSPDGKQIAASGSERQLIIWDFNSGAIVKNNFNLNQDIVNFYWTPDGTKIIYSQSSDSIRIMDVVSGKIVSSLEANYNNYSNFALNKNGTLLAITAGNNLIKVIDIVTGITVSTVPFNGNTVGSLAFSPDGTRIAGGCIDNKIRVWDIITGIELNKLDCKNNYPQKIVWNNKGNRIASTFYDFTIRIWNVDYDYIQNDISDAVFTIDAVKIQSKDIDMGNCIINTNKDSVITAFIQNTNQYDVKIDSIQFSGANAKEFSLVSGIPPILVPKNSNKEVEFSFKPTASGARKTKVVIYYQSADSVIQNITGTGFQNQIVLVNKNIDFGKVVIGSMKDTNAVATIKNVGTTPLQITKTKHNLPNDIDFTTLSGGGAFLLQPNEIAKVNLRYKANSKGRTNGLLEFYYDGVGSPAQVNLLGEGLRTFKLDTCFESSFIYPDFEDYGSLNLLYQAHERYDRLALNDTTLSSRGAFWHNYKVAVGGGFTCDYSFQLAKGDNHNNFDGSLPGGDGIAFVIQNSSMNEIGTTGGGIGYDGINNGFAIEIDTYNNTSDMNDPNGNHIAVQGNKITKKLSAVHNTENNIAMNDNIFKLKSNGEKYYCRVEYSNLNKSLKVYLDSTTLFTTPVIEISKFNLEDYVKLDKSVFSFVGFTSATGSVTEEHNLLSWRFCSDDYNGVLSVDDYSHVEITINNQNGIEFEVNEDCQIKLKVFDLLGNQIMPTISKFVSKGLHSEVIGNLSSGVYYYTIETNQNKYFNKFIKSN